MSWLELVAGLAVGGSVGGLLWWNQRQKWNSLVALVDQISLRPTGDGVMSGQANTPEAQRLVDASRKMAEALAQSEARAAQAGTLRDALDAMHTALMLVDQAGQIRYLNQPLLNLFRSSEAALRVELPGFQAGQLEGQSLALFNRIPGLQLDALKATQQATSTQFHAGDKEFDLMVCPVRHEQAITGYVIEWADRTQEARTEQEIQKIVYAAVNGDLSSRLRADDKKGFVRALALGLNLLMDAVENSMTDVAEILHTLSQGNLTRKMQGEAHGVFANIQRNMNSTVDTLRDIINQIKQASEHINVAAEEIAQGNGDLARRTEQQASNLEETASAMEQINSMVQGNARNASQANQLAASANSVASKGGEMVKGVVTTMSDIQHSSKRIEDIIGVIDGIAFQTNILALNAAVEAARAGEQGRGFAVVASEVRSLAQRSAQAAKEIKDLISESVAKVEGGAALVESAGTTMDDMVQSVQSVASLLGEISRSSQEQSTGVAQVAQAVVQMDAATQQNASLVEEAAAAANTLSEQAGALVHTTQRFKTDDGGQGLNGLDFGAAINAHRQWKGRLALYVQGMSQEKLDAAVVSCDDKCALGKWIYSDGKAISGDNLYSTLRERHANFHKCAGHIIKLHENGDADQAVNILSHEFTEHSKSTVETLRQLRSKYSK